MEEAVGAGEWGGIVVRNRIGWMESSPRPRSSIKIDQNVRVDLLYSAFLRTLME